MYLAEVAQKCDLIVLGAPSHAILSVVDSLMPHLRARGGAWGDLDRPGGMRGALRRGGPRPGPLHALPAPQPADDPRGAELWGAFKNPIALACGMADGLHPEGGDNLKAALVMAGFNEGMRLLGAMGAKTETAFGAAGLGDMYVTSTSQNSRNRTLGQKLGTGLSLEAALGEMHMVAEGVRATRMFRSEAQALGVEHPFLE